MMHKNNQLYSVVDESSTNHNDVHVMVHGEVILPFWDERKRELCISFCSGVMGTLLGMLLLSAFTSSGGGHPDSSSSSSNIRNPILSPNKPPVYNTTTTVEPLLPPVFSINTSIFVESNGSQKEQSGQQQQQQQHDDDDDDDDDDPNNSNNNNKESSSWWSIATDTVHGWLGGGDSSQQQQQHDTKLAGGGRDWLLNAQTGKVSSKHDPTFWLGVGPSPLILVSRESSKKLLFSKPSSSSTTSSSSSATKNTPTIDLVTHDSMESVGFAHLEVKEVNGYAYYDTVVSPFVDAVSVEYVQNKFLVLDDDWVLDIADWNVVEHQKVNFVKLLLDNNNNNNDDDRDNTTTTKSTTSAFVSGGGRDWVFQDDGSISPYLNQNLVLGMGSRGLIITQHEEMALHLSHSQELANAQTVVPMELKDEQQVVSTITAPPQQQQSQSQVDGWKYRETILADDTPVHIKYDGNFILLAPDEDYALDIANWVMEEGTPVNFVGGDD